MNNEKTARQCRVRSQVYSLYTTVCTPQCKQYRNINSNRVCREIRQFFSFFWLVLCEHLLLLDNYNYSTCMCVCENTKKRLKRCAVRAVQQKKISVGPLILQLFFVFGGKSIAGIASNSPTLSLRLTAVSDTGQLHLAVCFMG